MKAIILGGLSALIVGLLLFSAERLVTSYEKGNSQKLEFSDFSVPIPMTVAIAKSVAAQSQTGLITANALIIRNTGNDPIKNGVVKIIPDSTLGVAGILSVYEITPPGNDEDRDQITVQDGKGRVLYRLINPGEEHFLSIISDGATKFSYTSNVPNLKTVIRSSDSLDSERGTAWWEFAATMISAIAGVIVAVAAQKASKKTEPPSAQ